MARTCDAPGRHSNHHASALPCGSTDPLSTADVRDTDAAGPVATPTLARGASGVRNVSSGPGVSPNRFRATTWYAYVVPGRSPVSVADTGTGTASCPAGCSTVVDDGAPMP